MPPKKVSRKKLLKEPDEFMTTTGKVVEFVKTHRRKMGAGAVAALALLVVASGVLYYLRWQEGKALVIQQQAVQLYQEAYQASLEKPEAEKKEGFQKALEKFRQSLAAYGWGKSAQVSQVYIGHSHLALKEYDPAQAAYSKALDGPFRASALNGIASCLEAKGDYPKALEVYLKNAEEGPHPFRLESLMGAGRCYEALKEKPKALAVYEKALAQASKSAMAEFIRWKVSELKG